MTEHILTDAEKLKRVVDMASQQNSKSYEATNSPELKKVIVEAPKGSKILFDEMPDEKDNSMLMKKEHFDAVNEENTKSIKKQVKQKKDDGIESLKSEIAELKEIMKMQMEIDKMRKNQQVSNIVSKKPENMDSEGYIDMTKQASPMNVYQKDDMIMMSPKVQTPYDTGKNQPLPVSRGKSFLPIEVKSAINDIEVPKPIEVKPKKKIKSANYAIRWIIYSVLILVFVFGLLKFGININYFISGLFAVVITFGYSLTYYLLKVKVSEHQMPRKETVNYNNFEMAELKKCPQCNAKIQKSKVLQSADGFRQHIKCSNLECNFQKTIDVKKENGY